MLKFEDCFAKRLHWQICRLGVLNYSRNMILSDEMHFYYGWSLSSLNHIFHYYDKTSNSHICHTNNDINLLYSCRKQTTSPPGVTSIPSLAASTALLPATAATPAVSTAGGGPGGGPAGGGVGGKPSPSPPKCTDGQLPNDTANATYHDRYERPKVRCIYTFE